MKREMKFTLKGSYQELNRLTEEMFKNVDFGKDAPKIPFFYPYKDRKQYEQINTLSFRRRRKLLEFTVESNIPLYDIIDYIIENYMLDVLVTFPNVIGKHYIRRKIWWI